MDVRSDNLAGRESLKKKILKLYDDVARGFEAAAERVSDIDENWKIYNGDLGLKQLYNGRNELFIPIIYEAVQALATRFCNQLFPQTGRHIECISEDDTLPRAAMAVAEHYVRTAKVRELTPALILAGCMEGQYNVYVSWKPARRFPLRRIKNPVVSDGIDVGESDDILEEDQMMGGPAIELISDADVLISPVTCYSIDDALSSGGLVAIIRRWSKPQVRRYIDAQEIDAEVGEELLADMDQVENGTYRDMAKRLACDAGIRKDGRGVWALVYEIWTELDLKEDSEKDKDDPKNMTFRLCQIYMASKQRILMARRNPLWCDKCPMLSEPVERLPGLIKGIPAVSQVAKLQYFANDVLNESADSANYSLLPIILRDPAVNTSPLVLSPSAIWDVSPNDVKFAEFPPLYSQGLDLITAIKQEMFQVLTVNPANITQLTSKRKLNQAEVAQEQQIDLLNTSDAVTVLEKGIFTPMLGLFMDLDYQYRDEELTVRQFGEMGQQANLEKVPPLEEGSKYAFRWVGVEVARTQSQMQQKIAALNIIKSIPPQAYPSYTLDMQPIIVDIVETVYGPQYGRKVLKDLRSQISVDPTKENQLMDLGHYTPVHPLDKHQEHIPIHAKSMQIDGDPFRYKQAHITEHTMAMAAQANQQAQGMQGQQPGQQPQQQGPGARPGAQPDQGRPAQQPPGAIPQDQMPRTDPTVMPRKVG